MDPDRLSPLGWNDTGHILLGALPLASVVTVAGAFSFLSGYVQPPKDRRWLLGTMFLLTVLGAAICAAVVCVFGPELTSTLTYPFFIMIRSISLGDMVPRIEAVVITAWVGADFLLCTMLLRCAHEAIRTIFHLPVPDRFPMGSLRGGRWLLWLEAAAVFGCSLFFDLPPWQLRQWSDWYIPLASDIVLFGGFALLWLVTIPKRKKDPVCTENGGSQ